MPHSIQLLFNTHSMRSMTTSPTMYYYHPSYIDFRRLEGSLCIKDMFDSTFTNSPLTSVVNSTWSFPVVSFVAGIYVMTNLSCGDSFP